MALDPENMTYTEFQDILELKVAHVTRKEDKMKPIKIYRQSFTMRKVFKGAIAL